MKVLGGPPKGPHCPQIMVFEEIESDVQGRLWKCQEEMLDPAP